VVIENVRAAMQRKGLTQARVGAELGLSQDAISRRLLGKAQFKVPELRALAELLGVSVTSLIRERVA
jgi:transcriptional regulator with XRE-family HTH domain